MLFSDMKKIFEFILIPMYKPHFRYSDYKTLEYKINIWFNLFKNYDPREVAFAITDFIDNDLKGFPPTPGIIKKTLREFKYKPAASKSWDSLVCAIKSSLYNSVKNFESLDNITKQFVENPSKLKKWAKSNEIFIQSVLKEKFFEFYYKSCQKIENNELLFKEKELKIERR